MRAPDPVDVAAEGDIILSYRTLEDARQAVSPCLSPVAVLLDPSAPAGARLRDALPTVPLAIGGECVPDLLCGWAPREDVLRALRAIDPLEAIHLSRAPHTDVKLWTAVHARETCRVAEHGKRTDVTRAAEAKLLGFIRGGCFETRCNDGTEDHDWDEREVPDEETEEWRDDTTCVRCGMPYDLYGVGLMFHCGV